ncbi:MAG TPA: hypothetical protein VGP42_00945 [Stellaceae bacterium]|jgi:hypothetical protein|nr:hypothetical protein [Stellaceae bacterium]
MRDDLLHAQASVDWAVSQLPSLETRLTAWGKGNFDLIIEEQPPPATHDPIVAVAKEPLPLAFNVEVGAYINAIRSSLDILATALAYRYKVPRPDQACFPVAKSRDEFTTGKAKGCKFVKALPDTPRKVIEALKPYQGGNKTLWALHKLDIFRKHQRLLAVGTAPRSFSFWDVGDFSSKFKNVATGWMVVDDQKTVLGLLAKGAATPKMHFTPHVVISEASLAFREPVVRALNQFARLADSTIKLFDS